MLRKDDPVYYKNKLEKLLKEAKDNGLKIELVDDRIYFKANNLDVAEVKI